MKLISETMFPKLLIEQAEGSKDLFIKGVFMQADKKNRNGRIYPLETIKPEVDRYIRESVSSNRALGELNHPSRPDVALEFASHRITELKLDGSNYVGKALILETPQGNIVRGLIKGGVKLGVSSRGLGSLKEGCGEYRGAKVVQSDFRLCTAADIVTNPSAPDAFVEGIYESVDYMIKDGKIMETLEDTGYTIRYTLEEATKRNIKADQRAFLLGNLISKLSYRE